MLYYSNKALKGIDTLKSQDYPHMVHTQKGYALTKLGRYKEAEKNLLRALKICRSFGGLFSSDELYILIRLGELYSASDEFEKAQHHYDLAIEFNKTLPNSTENSTSGIRDKIRGLKAIGGKMRCFLQQEDSDLQEVIQYSNLAKQVVFDLRKSFQAEGTNLYLAKDSHDIFENSLTLIDRYSITDKKDPLLEAAFSYIEASKSVILYEALRDKKARLGLPKALRNQERVYKRNIAYYEKSLFDEQKSKEPNASKINQLKEELFSLQQNHKRFTDTLELLFPAYYQHKYVESQTKLAGVQSELQPTQAFLQYFVGESDIFVMGIQSDRQLFERIPLTDTLVEALSYYLNFLSNPNEMQSIPKGNAYIQNALAVYQALLEPLLIQMPEKVDQLIISPDGILSYVPFEALLTKETESAWTYTNLPYLIRSYAISYTHSATHWMEQKNKNPQNPPNNWLGFAPSYSDGQIKGSVQPVALNRFLTRDGSIQLPYAQEEISQISSLVNGKAYFQQTALESDFQRLASSYQVLHLATHGIVEDQQPMYSKLVFAPQDDSLFDGFLHAYEIYNMQLPADLVVLSACNTGIGKLEKGEGIMSLSRAFFYAGVKKFSFEFMECVR